MDKANTKLAYRTGINWMWFYVIIDDDVAAKFRLHMDEDICWDFLDLFEKSQRYMIRGSGFGYGGKKVEEPVRVEGCKMTDEFLWLNDFLRENSRYSGGGCRAHGVEFLKIEPLEIME